MRVDGLVHCQKPSGVIDGYEAALRSLLKGGTPYDMEASNVSLASYQPGLLSIPDDVHGCPDLSSVLSVEDRQYLEDDKLMLRVRWRDGTGFSQTLLGPEVESRQEGP